MINFKGGEMIRKFLDIFSKGSPREHFTEIYHKNIWRDKHSRSGVGSNLTQTEVIRHEMPKLIEELGVEVFIDAPCGDFFWMNTVNLNVCKYIGIDIVDDIIALNQKKYANEQREFLCRDIIKDEIPPADLILCRDCLVHLTFEQAIKVIRNFKRNKIKYLLCTTFVDRDKNLELPPKYGWRTLNMQKPPFNFPQPLKISNENCTEENNIYSDKSLGLWLIDDLIV